MCEDNRHKIRKLFENRIRKLYVYQNSVNENWIKILLKGKLKSAKKRVF